MEHLSKDKISIPNLFESSSQYTRNITDVVSHSKNSISNLSEMTFQNRRIFTQIHEKTIFVAAVAVDM